MTTKQLSVFVENKPGRLAEITKILEEINVDIRALSIADTTHFGILRLIVNNPEAAENALKGAGFTVSLTRVIAIEVKDEPGGLARALKHLTVAGITVEYMYAFITKKENSAYVIIRVEDNQKAIDVLEANHISVVCGRDIYDM